MAEEVQRTKEPLIRGKTLEHLKSLDVRESAKYLPARSRRSILRHFEVVEEFIKRCEKYKAKNKKIKTHLRDIVIVPKLVGFSIGVYNGKQFVEVQISSQMIGHRLGEFSPSTGTVKHSAAGIGATKSSRAQKK
ncbi:ribosomal protein S19 family protein [Candidatus Pacearchaeota archaeon]|nr:ribosomal protein S19 family protein [Candidatus Pacearchaeota archaeon]